MPFMICDSDVIARKMVHAFPWTHFSAVHQAMAIARRAKLPEAAEEAEGVTRLHATPMRCVSYEQTRLQAFSSIKHAYMEQHCQLQLRVPRQCGLSEL